MQSPLLFCSQNLWGLIFLALELWAGEPGYWAGTPCSFDILPEFTSTTHGCGSSLFHICAPPTSLDGCGSFNSVVVRLPLKLSSDGSDQRWFHILVGSWVWLCQEVSHVYLCLNLDLKLLLFIFYIFFSSSSSS